MTKEELKKFVERIKKRSWSRYLEEDDEIVVSIHDKETEYGYDDTFGVYSNGETFVSDLLSDLKREYGDCYDEIEYITIEMRTDDYRESVMATDE